MIVRGCEALAAVFGVSGRTARRWVARGCPVVSRGTGGRAAAAHTFETADVHAWLVGEAGARHPASDDEPALDLEAERARLAHHQADQVEARNLQLAGELVAASLVEHVVTGLCIELRTRLQRLPRALAPRVIGYDSTPVVEQVLQDGVRDALGGCTAEALLGALGLGDAPTTPAEDDDRRVG